MAIIAPAGFAFLPPLVNPLQAPVMAPPETPSLSRQAEAMAGTNATRTAADAPSFKRQRRRQSADEAGGGERTRRPTYGGLEGLALLSGATGRAVLVLVAAASAQDLPARLPGASKPG